MQAKGVIDDVGRALAMQWQESHQDKPGNPWSLDNIARIKNEFDADEDGTKRKYPEIFYYFDGLFDTKISQSVHPAGMVISPITLVDNFGVFDKDNDVCLMLDMENIHDFTGLAKYDFLILKTVQVIRDTCRYLNQPYPKSHEINWDDELVWADMIEKSCGIFQFEGKFAFESLKKFKPHNLFDMSLVTACIRPSGASYRDDLLAHKPHKNPSPIIDDLLKGNEGYLIYQEDTIKFLQQICGLSGSSADNIRRAIGRKQKDRLDAAMPSILDGYCSKSDRPRDEAEQEAKEFLQVIEDSASYQFGYNHSIAYCMLGYLCAYYRYYHPLEFLTSFLNNAANDEDIQNGTAYANIKKIRITPPRWGFSRSGYFYDKEKNVIAKGVSSIKYMNEKLADELYNLAHENTYTRFMDLLFDIDRKTSMNTRQLDILIKLDFFAAFGNQRELLKITDLFYGLFKKGEVKKLSKEKIDGTLLEPVVRDYAVGLTKSGGVAKSYTVLDVRSIMNEAEDIVKSAGLRDLSDILKIQHAVEVMGYMGYTSGRKEDRRKLYIMDMYPLTNHTTGRQFGYRVKTKSIGSGIESEFTIYNREYKDCPVKKNDVVLCKKYEIENKNDRRYYVLKDYEIMWA